MEGQKEELSNTLAVIQSNRKKEDSFSFLARNQLIKSHAYLLRPLTLLPSSRKGLSFPVEPGLTCGSPCWQISPDSDLFLLDKYLTVCLFQVNRWNNNCNMFKICGLLYLLKIHSNNESEITKTNQDWLFGISRTSLNKMLKEVTQMEGK